MGDMHTVIVDNVGKVIGRIAVGLQQNLILQLLIFHRDLSVNRVLEGGRALQRHFLTNNIGDSLSQKPVYLFLRQIPAVAVVTAADALLLVEGVQPLFGTEAVISLALFHQLFRIGLVHILSLALYIRAVFTAHIRALVMLQAYHIQRAVDYLHSAIHQPLLVGVLDPQNEFPALGFGDQIFIKRRSQITHMHKPGRTRRIPCSDFHVHFPFILP